MPTQTTIVNKKQREKIDGKVKIIVDKQRELWERKERSKESWSDKTETTNHTSQCDRLKTFFEKFDFTKKEERRRSTLKWGKIIYGASSINMIHKIEGIPKKGS